ncbi:MAG: hypothetical protein HYY62_04545 [Deltaproteobacteria bacterium]|nr:hypothetical protein [Deltaproteobacteria bacterium]
MNLKFIWLTMFASILAYGGVLYFLLHSGSYDPSAFWGGDKKILLYFFSLPALGCGGIILFLWNKYLRNPLSQTPGAIRVPFSLNPNKLSESQWSTMNIVCYALAEAISIFGFVLSLLTAEFKYFINFSIPACLLLILLYPRYLPSRK